MQNGCIFASHLESDVAIMFLHCDFLKDAKVPQFAYFKADERLLCLHELLGPLGLKWRFMGQNRGRSGAVLTPNEVAFTVGDIFMSVLILAEIDQEMQQ